MCPARSICISVTKSRERRDLAPHHWIQAKSSSRTRALTGGTKISCLICKEEKSSFTGISAKGQHCSEKCPDFSCTVQINRTMVLEMRFFSIPFPQTMWSPLGTARMDQCSSTARQICSIGVRSTNKSVPHVAFSDLSFI